MPTTMRRLILTTLTAALFATASLAQQNSAQPPAAPQAGTAQPPVSSPDPLLDVPPLPQTRVTLVGGTVTGVDRVHNRLTVEPFGGKKMKFVFDERTHIYRDGVETTQLGIRKGDRVYVDTQLDGSQVFARNIRVENKMGPADARGQIISYDAGRGTLIVRDELSAQPVTFKLGSETLVRGKARSAEELKAGSLVNVRFAPDGDRGLAQEVFVTAAPGETYTFSGKLLYLDMSRGMFSLQNQTDNKTYEIRFDPSDRNVQTLSVGSDVSVSTEFDAQGYKARSITLNQAKAQ